MQSILLITDGSPSGVLAEDAAVDLARRYEGRIRAVYILDQSWQNLLGDEWMNTSETRMTFFRYLEDALYSRASEVLKCFTRKAEKAQVSCTAEVRVGKPDQVVIETAKELTASLVVIPNPVGCAHPAAGGIQFLAGRIAKKISCPLLVGAPASPERWTRTSK
ncbi:universal stress protein [Desulforudis sp. DRI-14]|uniref:universal stress protein n=1 Tax=Desulforudis sp. DRI-14 TaxID=3459793 RepID=UPI0040430574